MMYLYLFLIFSCSIACNGSANDDLKEPDIDLSEPEVMVERDKEAYQVNEKIRITIKNMLEEPVTSMDQQTYCTIILLEEQKETGWLPVKNCTLNAPAREVTINANSSEFKIVEIVPDQQSAETLQVGTYRATLVYSKGEHFKPAENSTAYSETFDVQ